MNKKISDIEVLRAFAVIFVCIEHINVNLFSWSSEFQRTFYGWTGMWSGVDLFLVISGFVITRDLLPKINGTTSNTEFFRVSISFWIRRAWRLIPSAWLWLMVILIGCVIFNQSGAWGSFRANLEGSLAAFFNVANLRVWAVYGVHEAGATFPYWSLSLEEQFYLILPFLILFSGKRLSLVLGIIVLLQLLLPRYPLMVILRTDALALGVLIAIWSTSESYQLFKPVFLKSMWAKIILLPLLALGLILLGGEDFHIPLEMSLIAFISAILVFISSYDENYIFPNGWLKNILMWIGARSYAIYLIHIPAYFATREIWFRLEPAGTIFNGSYTLEYLLTTTIIIIVFAELNYRLIEVPLRRRGAVISANYAK